MFQRLWAKLKQSKEGPPKPEIYSGTDGLPPSTSFPIADLNANVAVSGTGPDGGVQDLLPCTPGLHLTFDNMADCPWAYGHSTSLYDAEPSGSGARAGDPIADCFALVAYENHTVLVVADGVNWGEPARRAARGAVLGVLAHLHAELPKVMKASSSATTDAVFRHMIKALDPAQKLILMQFGTLTTLVVTVVARLAAPMKRRSLRLVSPQSSSAPRCYHWVAMTVTVGDSAAFVYRHLDGIVEELTEPAHAGAYRDPRWTPGALGYAQGEEPDLSNLTCTLTLLNEGDIVFLTSDGVADNFDPFILKLASQACNATQWMSMEESAEDNTTQPLPVIDATESQVQQMRNMTCKVQELREGGTTAAGGGGGLTAKALVQGLLDHVMAVTEDQRKWTERKQKQAALDAQLRRRSHTRELPSLSTDARILNEATPAPPGKMDHATAAAFLVGGARQ